MGVRLPPGAHDSARNVLPGYDPHIIEAAYRHCTSIARTHYENFPVASLLVPRRLRKHIAAVYAFARAADDMADEGSFTQHERLAALSRWRSHLNACADARNDEPIFIALADTIDTFRLPLDPFHHLIDAFEQDVTTTEYETFADLLHYCSRSANPIGRLLLHFFECSNERTIRPADALCTGLQLANFWQDVAVDALKSRSYLPREDRERFGVTMDDIRRSDASVSYRALLHFEVERTRMFFADARALFPLVPLRLRFELQAIWRGGIAILDAIARNRYDTLSQRPALSSMEKARILLHGFFPTPSRRVVYEIR